ncbi:MAG: hypothetical protein M1829_001856 [Trizodia sp. TS-e1964]|nr:MAG: hypothetical protein M1829_001856 [Trizodia sp. TS-e1964]
MPPLRGYQTLRFYARMPSFFRSALHRRFQSSQAAGTGAVPPGPTETIFQKMWNGPVGLKTVHFWAPVMKWGLVLTGASDFYRPAENLSLTQNIALTCTGVIWTRWCLIIKPKNYLLACVNFFLGVVGTIQVSRILLYRRSLGNGMGTSELQGAKDRLAKEAGPAKS